MEQREGLIRRLRRSMWGLAAYAALSYVVLSSVLRLTLLLVFHKGIHAPLWQQIAAWFIGFHQDLFVAGVLTIPLLLWFALTPRERFGGPIHRALTLFGLFLFFGVQVFIAAVEFFFYEEFQSRFTTVAVDYLLYPTEVFVNIWESYPVIPVILICALIGALWAYSAWRWFGEAFTSPPRASTRWFVTIAIMGVLFIYGMTVPWKRGVHFSSDRPLNQIANNGQVCFVAAAWTRHLDFPAFYKTIDREEAYRRVHRMLEQPGVEFTGGLYSTRRKLLGDPSRPRLNVVILLEESFGSSFWGILGAKKDLTPNMDRIANEEGWLFTNIYATGNRTVRGLEGVICGFPPLPGDSIVWRLESDNVETLARVLKRDGYHTVFMYAGRGLFDRMKGFSLKNGFDEFLEEKDCPKITFKTIWGMCDEDLLNWTIQKCRKLYNTGKPFFVLTLTVSNHKPYLYPTGRIPEDPFRRKRAHAVKYADYALGKFFEAVKKEPYWKNTIFVVVADHGARVYGSEDIPIHSYEIPFLVVGPAVVDRPRRFDMLGCQMDIPMTILAMIGRPYEVMFFGRNLLKLPKGDGRAFLNHNRDIGMFAKERLVVLGLRKTVEFWKGDPKKTGLELLPHPGPFEKELERDAIAMFQVADEMYMNHRYHLDPDPTPEEK